MRHLEYLSYYHSTKRAVRKERLASFFFERNENSFFFILQHDAMKMAHTLLRSECNDNI